ncbi:M20/M25/M40 family metallo-hydrolase [uncultured Martelella sp.]|uniref:M20 family metallopeptidase n=1 Tax=uncultured Martelella sp. TaxID=392331 RepID=UPI0029C88A21|nr:M20/M25/M40 family metallo-hydrolase [uncultured Martelella sp.]
MKNGNIDRCGGFDDAAALLDGLLEPALDVFSALVAADTTFPPGSGYAGFADLVEGLFVDLGYDFRRVTVPESLWHVPGGPASGDRVNVIGEPAAQSWMQDEERAALGLYYHVDTVPVAPGWTRDPFRLTREGECLYGLGAADMKGTIAATWLALAAARKAGIALAYRPQLYFCTDEEGGLYPGVRYLAEQGLLPPHLLNFNGVAAPRIWGGSFGSFSLLVRITGVTSHGSSASGINAIEAALPMMNALVAEKANVAAITSAMPAPPDAEGPLRPVLSLSAAHGGTCGGQIPAAFEVIVSRRYALEEDFDTLRDGLETLIRDAVPAREGLGLSIDLIGHLTPTADADGPHWPRWQAALSEGFGYAPESFAKWAGASASDFGYVQRTGLTQEALLSGLGGPGRNGHGPDEHTTISDLTALARAILAYLARDFSTGMIPEQTSSKIKGEPN